MHITRILAVLLMLGFASGRLRAGTNSPYWTNAEHVHGFVVSHLLTSHQSYRIQPHSSTAYAWYVASQIYADATMVAAGDASYIPGMNNAFMWMSNLWDKADSNGGYWSTAKIDGSNAGGGKYVDDNALIGNVFLDCYEISSG